MNRRSEVDPATDPGLWRPSTRAQWATVAVTLVWAAVLAVALPLWATATAPEAAGVDADGRVSVTNLSVTPADGWIVDPEATESIKLDKADASLLIFPATPSPETPTSAVEASVAIFKADTTVAYSIGDVQTFTTESGLRGASALVLDPESATIVVAVSDGTNLAQGVVTAKSATWDDIQEEADAMLRTLSIESGAQS